MSTETKHITEENALLNEYNSIKEKYSVDENKLIVAHIGTITQQTIITITYYLENQLDLLGESRNRVKKVVNTSIEVLQNTLFHAEKNDGGFHLAYFIVAYNSYKNEFNIFASNHVKNKEIGSLNSKIGKINESSVKELSDSYFEIYEQAEFSSSGGGGLGLLTIALACDNNIEFSTKKTSESYTLFSLKATIE